FFQAEDGIRDYKVTGVQTCALPIFSSLSLTPPASTSPARIGCSMLPLRSPSTAANLSVYSPGGRLAPATYSSGAGTPLTAGARRSEERRVGKECGSRWWPGQYQKEV